MDEFAWDVTHIAPTVWEKIRVDVMMVAQMDVTADGWMDRWMMTSNQANECISLHECMLMQAANGCINLHECMLMQAANECINLHECMLMQVKQNE